MKTALGIGCTVLWLGLYACGGGAPPPQNPTTPPASAPAPPGASGASGDTSAASPSDKGGPEVDRAIVAIKANDFRSAKAALEQALHKNPKNGTASYYMGVALENLGDKAGAEQEYKNAL